MLRILLFLLLISPIQAGLKDFLRKLTAPVMGLVESTIGGTVARSMRLSYGVYQEDPALVAWAEGIFQKVAAEASGRSTYNLTVLDQEFLNAFAVPGGHVFVTEGLLMQVRSDAELAAVIGHEIGHIDGRHSMNSMEHQILWQWLARQLKKRDQGDAATAMQVFSAFKGLRYSRKNEQEADLYGARYAAQAGYNPAGMESFLKLLKGSKDEDPHRLGIALMTHPPTTRRIEYARDYQDQLPPRTLNRPMRLTRPGASKPLAMASPPAFELLIEFSPRGGRWPGVAPGLELVGSKGLYALENQNGKFYQRIQSLGRHPRMALETKPYAIPQGRHQIRQAVVADLLEGQAYFELELTRPQGEVLEKTTMHAVAGQPFRYTLQCPLPECRLRLRFGLYQGKGKAFFGPISIASPEPKQK